MMIVISRNSFVELIWEKTGLWYMLMKTDRQPKRKSCSSWSNSIKIHLFTHTHTHKFSFVFKLEWKKWKEKKNKYKKLYY